MMLRLNIFIYIILKIVFVGFLFSLQVSAALIIDQSLLGRKFPKFNMNQLDDSKEKISEKIFIGSPKIVHFWSTEDGLSDKQQKILATINSLGIIIIGINIRDDLSKNIDLPYNICLKDNKEKLVKKLDIKTLPATFIIDSSGIIRYQITNEFSGDSWGEQLESAYKNTVLMQEVKTNMEI